MVRLLTLVIALSVSTSLLGQLNMTLLSQIEYPTDLNDIWHWVDEDTGTEYAIVGLRNGVSIVSLEDPENATEVVYIPGQSSTWRDIKTWGDWAYVTTDQGGTTEGLTVIDMSQLPDAAPYYHWTPSFPNLGGTLETCHNLYIDEFGYCYLAGCNLNGGGPLVIDVFTEPGVPSLVSACPPIYSHDVYARDNRLYSSEIYVGNFTVYDVEDKQNITPIGTQPTPFTFTHNTWLSDDGSAIFTTDELANAPVAAYDISDLDEIVELDQYVPIETIGNNVIPHNVHVWNDYLIISYYTDGGRVVDAANPSNLIEVGNFDTFFGGGAGFNGAWGADPFLPSGIVLISDINSGLYVLAPDYKRACYLEGNVTDGLSSGPLSGVEVEILAGDHNMASTDLSGDYKTGQVTAGVFEVQFTKPGYITVIEEVTLENGVLVELDVVMQPVASVTGTVIQDTDGNPIEGAQVSIIGAIGALDAVTNSEGVFQSAIEPGSYVVTAGAWGYLHGFLEIDLSGNETLTIELTQGYQDDFVFDQGWQTSSTASSGDWELVDPSQSTFGNQISTPGDDIQGDLGNRAYVTGNGGNDGSNDVDNGVVTLTSPSMDLAQYNEPIVSFYTYFFNDGGDGSPNDALNVKITNGFETVTLESTSTSVEEWNEQSEYNLTGLLAITDDMNLIVETSDLQGSGHIVEAAFDAFLVTEGAPDTTSNVQNLAWEVSAKAFPNPFLTSVEFQYQIDQAFEQAQLIVRTLTGQEVARSPLEQAQGSVRLGAGLPAGTYFLELVIDGQLVQTLKAVKN